MVQKQQAAEDGESSKRSSDFSVIDSEVPLSQYNSSAQRSATDLFMHTEAAQAQVKDPEFQALFDRLQDLFEEEENRTDEPAPNLPPEDDYGNTEYKLMLTGLSMYKVKKRTTQMAFRLVEGGGEAFYEIGVHDNGELVGIYLDECAETLSVLYYIAKSLHADLSVELVRLGTEGYSYRLKVTKPQPEQFDPEVDSFIKSINQLKKQNHHQYKRLARQRSDSHPVFIQDKLHQPKVQQVSESSVKPQQSHSVASNGKCPEEGDIEEVKLESEEGKDEDFSSLQQRQEAAATALQAMSELSLNSHCKAQSSEEIINPEQVREIEIGAKNSVP